MDTNNEIIETNPFEHILYEFSMYLHASVIQSSNQFETNLLVDSCMVHMRNLAYFFYSESKGKKYFHYFDYIAKKLPSEISHDLFGEIQHIASNSTCHLLKGRLDKAFKDETASLERLVFPIMTSLIKNFIIEAKDNVRPEYLLQWQNKKIQKNVRGLEQLISEIENYLGKSF